MPLGRLWIRLLLVGYMLPVVVAGWGASLWIWPWTGWSEAAGADIAFGLAPVFLGLVAWALLGLGRRRLRGALLILACAAAMLVPYGRVVGSLGEALAAGELLVRHGWQGLALTLGCVAVAAGNRQQKRSLGRGAAPWIASAGGLLLLAGMLSPVLGLVGASRIAGGELWSLLVSVWPLVPWCLALLTFGVLGLLSPLSARLGDPLQAWVERGISRLARWLPWTLPLLLLALYAVHGLPGFGLFFLFLTKIVLCGYAVLFLLSIGLARLLDNADPAGFGSLPPREEQEVLVPPPEAAAGTA